MNRASGQHSTDPVDDEDVSRRLAHQQSLAALLQLPVEHPVPEHVLERAASRPSSLERLLRVAVAGVTVEVAQVELLGSADWGVAVEQDAQERRPRSGRSRARTWGGQQRVRDSGGR